MGLSPGGHEPVARLIWHKGGRWAWLYRVDLAEPKRKPTLAQELALDKAMAARQTYPLCMRRYFACLPLKALGSCLECHDGTPADSSSYIAPPATHQLASQWRSQAKCGPAQPSRPRARCPASACG
ncbi:RRQRL motif-containing zinc-binding protein [Streptomyces sp. NPDC004012]